MIRYKLIERERFGDAPFVGVLISAISCNINCEKCFNQHIKDLPILLIDSDSIINEVLLNPFEKGIIFGGLEWSNQPKELIKLSTKAKKYGLEVMIYTGLSEYDFDLKVGIDNLPSNIYVKFGGYIDKLKCDNNKQYGIKLASSNQYIKYFKKEL